MGVLLPKYLLYIPRKKIEDDVAHDLRFLKILKVQTDVTVYTKLTVLYAIPEK